MRTELRKKTAHILMGIGFTWAITAGVLRAWHFLIILPVLLLFTWPRARGKMPLLERWMRQFDRKDKAAGIGAVWFVLGVLLVWLVFGEHPQLVAAAIMVLTFGDTASSLFGRRFGETPNPLNRNKLIEGTAAGVFAAFIGAWWFVPWLPALVGAVAGMLVETMEFRYQIHRLDDNLIVPIVAALAMYPLV
jgi:dolichol kinase